MDRNMSIQVVDRRGNRAQIVVCANVFLQLPNGKLQRRRMSFTRHVMRDGNGAWWGRSLPFHKSVISTYKLEG